MDTTHPIMPACLREKVKIVAAAGVEALRTLILIGLRLTLGECIASKKLEPKVSTKTKQNEVYLATLNV